MNQPALSRGDYCERDCAEKEVKSESPDSRHLLPRGVAVSSQPKQDVDLSSENLALEEQVSELLLYHNDVLRAA